MKTFWGIGLSLVSGLMVGIESVWAAEPTKEILVDQVQHAITEGKQFLSKKQQAAGEGKGHWEIGGLSIGRPGGMTCLVLLALLNAGVPSNDPAVETGLNYIRDLSPEDTYVVALQTMVFAKANNPKDRERIQRNVDWLIKAWNDNGKEGWTYKQTGAGSDNSNTQYALLGLHEGFLAGAKIPTNLWEEIHHYYVSTQRPDGAWGYSPQTQNEPRLTMTTAGLSGLVITEMDLKQSQKKEDPPACAPPADDPASAKALDWIARHFRIENESSVIALYYNLYGIERAGRLSGRRFLGDHDWYREGCQFLVQAQNKDDGSWEGPHALDQSPVVSTSFALLFLSKGRIPVLMSKMLHGPGDDWNNAHNDARHLAEFASREMFKDQPLAWQAFETRRALDDSDPDTVLKATGTLLQAPIAYISGEEAPQFTGQEEQVLKEFLEQGGFIVAEARCGNRAFDSGFRKLMERLFPDTPLQPLQAEHPIWSAWAPVKPGAFQLEGMERGCKTVVVYSPQGLSSWWEENQSTQGQGKLAFQVGGNIIAYATGMELPRPRLTEVEVINDKGEEKKVPRGFLKVVQLKHEGDWQPAPRAMHNLMTHLREKLNLDVSVQAETLLPSNPNVREFKFLYLHGRGAFTYSREGQDKDSPGLANLRADLQTGGLLFADACCGNKTFDQAFRKFAIELFPDKKLEPIPLNDALYGKDLTGQTIATVRRRGASADGNGTDPEMQEVPPFLEGIKIDNRWVIIYSKYDIGCALEKHQSPGCLGHDYASAVKLGTAVVVYAMKR